VVTDFLDIEYIMKVKALYIFLALLFALGVCSFAGFCTREGLTANNEKPAQKPHSFYRNRLDRDQRAKDDQKDQDKLKSETGPGQPASLSESDSPYTQLHTGPSGEKIMATPQNTVLGVPKSKIPPGQDDLYILKSEVVPPVCPACPSGSVCPREKPCPPCPACARCPEPAFECAKVPNYRADGPYAPRPVLTDFSGFGM